MRRHAPLRRDRAGRGILLKIWLCDLTYDQQTLASDTMPTNIGYLACYLKRYSADAHELRLFKYPGTLISAVRNGDLPDLVGFSHFMWNSRLNCAVAAWLKRQPRPITVVFGGLNYPGEPLRQRTWFQRHPMVDFHVVKEGEAAFFQLVEMLSKTENEPCRVKELDLPGVHYLKNDSSFYGPEPASRVRELGEFPSPYLSGLLDSFFDGRLMPLITTNRGCPFSCTFCAEGVLYYNKVNRFPLERIEQELEYIGQKIGRREDYARREIYISDSNFGMYKEDLEVARLFKRTMDRYGWPRFVIATTGKNNKERVLEAARIMDGRMSLTGSVQSLDPEVLQNIRRQNISAEALLQTAMAASSIGANSYSDIILGLPGDSLAAHESTLRRVVNARLDYVNTYQLRLQEDSEMTREESKRKFQLKSRYRVLTRSYGNYPISDTETLSIAEVEEVCVEGERLPFSDYLTARLIHLIIATFYNDRFFAGILKLLDLYGVERYAWIQELHRRSPATPGINNLFSQYLQATRAELWESEEEMLGSVSGPEVIERYLSGELGANLLGKYRILAMTDRMQELCALAEEAAWACLERSGEGPELRQFLTELVCFEQECKRDLLSPDLPTTELAFSYDILRFLSEEPPAPIQRYRFPLPKRVRFFRPPEVSELMRKHQAVFGTSIMGRYKQMTRTPVKNLYRQAVYVDAKPEGAACLSGA